MTRKLSWTLCWLLMAGMLSVSARSSADTDGLRIFPTDPDVSKTVSVSSLNLSQRSADELSIRYMKLPEASPFCTEADFIVPFESRLVSVPSPVAGMASPSAVTTSVNLPKTLPTFYYMPLYDQAWVTAYDFSLCSFDPNTGTVSRLEGGDAFYGADFAVAAGETLYTSVPLSNGATYRFTVALNPIEVIKQSYKTDKIQALSAAYDKTTGTIYTCCLNADKTAFFLTTFDPATGETGEEILSYGSEGMSAMGCTRTGQLVGISNAGTLYSIDKTTGERTKIASYNLPTSYNSSGCCDLTRNIFYYAYFGGVGNSNLIAFDLGSGAVQEICTIPRSIEMQGLWIPFAPFDDGMPGEPTGYAVEFADDSLSGTIRFTLPSTTYGGETPQAGSKVDYEILVDDIVKYTGSGDYGETVVIDANVEKRGTYTFQLKVSNEAGYGETLSQGLYIGYDDVTDIKSVDMNMSDTSFSLVWTPVTAVHGGYVNPEHISYDVVRYPDGTSVATGTRATRLEVPITSDLPDGTYYFGVTAHFYNPDTKAIEAKNEVKSGVRVRGDYKVPFTYSLSNAYEASQIFSVEDSNHDNVTWAFSSQGAVAQYNESDPTIAMDDWLFSMPIHLEANVIYNFMTNVYTGNEAYPERLEIKAGTEAKSGAMTIDIVPKTTVNGTRVVAGSFFVETAGTYYIGIHGCSDPDMYYMVVEDISMSSAGTVLAPGMPENLSFEAVYGTNLEQAMVRFNAPSVTANRQPLESIGRIEVLRDDELVKTFDNPTPGAALDYLDTIVKRGTQEYKVVAYNEHGTGMSAVGTVFVGYGTPYSVEKINTAIVADDDNTVRLWWDPVTHDMNGRRIDRTMWYQPNLIFPNSGQSTAGNGIYASPGFTHANIHKKYAELNPNYDAETNVQFFVRYYLSNFYYEGTGLWEGPTHSGTGHPFSVYVPVGKSYTLPFRESFAGGAISHVFNHDDHGTYGAFIIADASPNPSAQPYDGDGGMVVFKPEYLNDAATLYSGRIDLRDAVIPKISFYYYAVPGSQDMIEVTAGDSSDDMRKICSVRVGSTQSAGWTKAVADMSMFKGKVVQFGMTARCVSGSSLVLIDDIEITDPEDNNLALGELQVPAYARADRTMTVSVPVTNNGHYDMNAYTATLYVNETPVAKHECEPLPQGKTGEIIFTYTPNVTHTEGLWVKIAIEADDDSDASDNVTDELFVEVTMPSYPAVSDLKASADGVNVSLDWSRPSGVGDVAEMMEDGVETYPAFSIGLPSSELGEDDYIGNWTVYDIDGQPTTQIANKNFTNNRVVSDGMSSPKAWMVFNIEKANVPAAYVAGLTPRSGKQCFICPAAEPADDVHGNDDWLVSPLLSGKAQTVTFFAKSISTAYGYERFEILYSKGSSDIDDFESISVQSVDDNWHLQSAELPEGTRYFAIRCISYDAWALLVDDLVYEAGADEALQLTGFNVYRNRELIVNEPVAETTFSDQVAEESVNDYHVSAVYNLGESALSNMVTIDLTMSGLDSVSIAGITVSVADCVITVTGADGRRISVATADGRIVTSVTGGAVTGIPVSQGVYVVTVGKMAVKLVVR